MSKDKQVDWQTSADILNDATDEEISAAMKELNPTGQTAGEQVAEGMAMLQAMGLMPQDEDDEVMTLDELLAYEEGEGDYEDEAGSDWDGQT